MGLPSACRLVNKIVTAISVFYLKQPELYKVN